jgi:heme-binding protein
MLRLIRRLFLIAVMVFVVIQLAPAGRTNPPVTPSQTIERTLSVPPPVQAILERSCKDCHSNKTTWPWYAYVAPASWLLVMDVNHAREEMNFSEWGVEDVDAQRDSLLEICRKVKSGAMPLRSYTLLHRAATLSPEDVTTLCTWTETARRELRQRQ